MVEEFLVVVRAFQSEVRRAAELLASRLGTTDRAEQRRRVLAQGGYVDAEKKHRCRFHGAGCRVQLSRNRAIDWDYGHGGRIDGFDLWRLEGFLRSRPKLQRVLPVDHLEDAFGRARETGTIATDPRRTTDPLYYLVEDLGLEKDLGGNDT